MKTEDSSSCFRQGLPVAFRLRSIERAKREGGFFFADIVGNIHIRRMILRQLNEHAVSGITLVQLSRGMKITRSITVRHRQSVFTRENVTQTHDRLIRFLRRTQEYLQTDIITRLGLF